MPLAVWALNKPEVLADASSSDAQPPARGHGRARDVPRPIALIPKGMLPEAVLERAATRRKDDRLPTLVAAMRTARPNVTLQEMCDMLEEMRVPTPRGRESWYPSSAKALLDRAGRVGLASQGTVAPARGRNDQDAIPSGAGR